MVDRASIKWVWGIIPHSEVTSDPEFFRGTRAEAVEKAKNTLRKVPGGLNLIQYAPWADVRVESIRDLSAWEEHCARIDKEETEA